MSGKDQDRDGDNLLQKIAFLEQQLAEATHQLQAKGIERDQDTLHILLLLADSALPLGSFAFSSGLESFLSHARPPSASQHAAFQSFLRISLSSVASTSLPYLTDAYNRPENIEIIDNDFDASTPCTVARRASVAQGRALLSLWDRSFKKRFLGVVNAENSSVVLVLDNFTASMRRNGTKASFQANAHLAPIWGLITRVLGLPLRDSIYLFLFSHARNIANAGVRASVVGPYQAQSILASKDLQELVSDLIKEYWHMKIENAGQTAPIVDIWIGRHEKLYSRIFNS